MRAADLREKGADDLRELHKTLTRDVFENRLKNFTNRLDDTSAIRKTRRDLARVNTVLREREAAATPAPSPAPVVRPETAATEASPAKKKAAAPKKAGAAKKAADAGVAAAEAASTKKAAAKRSEAK
jgi:large subunit ribosomal protein L29